MKRLLLSLCFALLTFAAHSTEPIASEVRNLQRPSGEEEFRRRYEASPYEAWKWYLNNFSSYSPETMLSIQLPSVPLTLPWETRKAMDRLYLAIVTKMEELRQQKPLEDEEHVYLRDGPVRDLVFLILAYDELYTVVVRKLSEDRFRLSHVAMGGQWSHFGIDVRSDQAGSTIYPVTFDLSVIAIHSFMSNDPWIAGNGSGMVVEATYRGTYDFMTFVNSGPVVSRLQNPSIGLLYDWTRADRRVDWLLGVGFAHESNGQYVDSQEAMSSLKGISTDYYLQEFASMGWNYSWLRTGWRWPSEEGTKTTLWSEIRLYSPQNGWPLDLWSPLEDGVNVTGVARDAAGVRAYDGVRLGGQWSNQEETVVLRLAVKSPYDFWKNRFGFDFEIMCPQFANLYARLQGGYSFYPSHYFMGTVRASFGFSVDTSFLSNAGPPGKPVFGEP